MTYPTPPGGDGYQNRNEAFSHGVTGGPVYGSPGLAQAQERANEQVTGKFTPQGMNQAVSLSSNGMSASQEPRRMLNGAMLGSQNGVSASTYSATIALQKVRSSGPGTGVL